MKIKSLKISQATSKINENRESELVKCQSADNCRTNTDSDGFKTLKRKHKENSTKTVSIIELPLSKSLNISLKKIFLLIMVVKIQKKQNFMGQEE